MAAAAHNEAATDVCEVHEDNAIALSAFLALQTQWRVIAGMGGVIFQGIDYAAVPVVLSMLGVRGAQRAEVFGSLRIMEATAVPILNAKPEKTE